MKTTQRNPMKRQSIGKNRKILGEALFFIFLGIFLLIILRFADLSIFKSAHNVNLVRQTRNLYTQSNVIRPRRGTIYDANGQPLAEDDSTYSIYLVLDRHQKTVKGKPLYVTNKSAVSKTVARYLPISQRRVFKALHPSKQVFQVSLGNPGQNISLTTKRKLERHHLNGIHFKQQQARLYPNGTFASHLIGMAAPVTSKTGTTKLVGQMGLESALNRELTGRFGFRRVERNDLTASNPRNRKMKNGDDVYTTLDYRLQSLLENRMSKINHKDHPGTMGAILMNARTGDLLAATQRPSFNPTTRKGLNSVWRDVITQDLYEPGSTMKAFTIAASIDSHHYHGNATYNSGKYYIDGKLVPDWNPGGWGQISYNKGFALSSNVAMAHLERNMGSKVWRNYIHRFRLISPVGIGLKGNSVGMMRFKQPIEQANTAFGQGIEVNMLEMMRGLSAISNNGTMLQPRLISKIVNPMTHRQVKHYGVKSLGRPISKRTARLVRQHMEDVVYKPYGIGHAYQIHGYRIAAKTGTAQISNGKGYSSGNDNYLYSVAGIAPANHPKYVLYLTMKKPKVSGENTAAIDLAQIFKPVMRQALTISSHPLQDREQRMPDLKGCPVRLAREKLEKLGLKVNVRGSNTLVKDQSIAAGEKVIRGNRVVLFCNK